MTTNPIIATPTNPLVEQVAKVSAQVTELSTQRTTYVAGTVTALNNTNITFAADILQPDGTTTNVAGIRTSAQFMPSIGTVVTLALSGPQIIYQPFGVASGSIDSPQLSTTVNSTISTATSTANTAQTTANAAQTTANSKITTFYAGTAPTSGMSSGDLWINTASNNTLHRYSGTTWVQVQDQQIQTALTNAGTAQATADGKIVTFSQSTAPTGQAVGDLWVDTGNGNLLKRWTGSVWTNVQDTAIQTGITAANNAQTTANTANTTANTANTTANTANTTANTAQTTANGKNKVTYSTAAASGSGTATGDIWWQTDGSGNVTASWAWTGSAWVSHSFGDAMVNSLTAGKITAGTMTANVTIAGRYATALTGARVELNSSGLQKWDSGGNQLVSITGTDNLLTGTFKTALTGRRIEVGVGGTTGQINFTNASGGALGNVIAQTATNGTEVIEMVAPITSTDPAYNGVSVQGNERIFTISNQVVSQYAGTSALFEVDSLSSKATGWTASARYKIDETNGHQWWTGSAVSRMVIGSAGFALASTSAINFFDQLVASSNNRIRIMPNGPGLGTVEVLDRGGVSQQSARLALVQDTGGAVQLKCYLNELQVRDNTDTIFAPVDASVFNVSSDADGKTNITDATVDAVGKIRGLRPRNYQRKGAPGQSDSPVELGLVASEAPPEIVVSLPSGGVAGQGINLYSYVTLIAAGLQQGLAALDALTTRVAALEAKGKP